MSASTHSPNTISQYWLLLAVSSLGLSAVAALVLVLARTPVLTALVAEDTFPRALVVHVNLATLIWYLSMAAALWSESLPAGRRRAALAAFALGAIGACGVIAAGFGSTGAPVLANYVPYLQTSAFLGSLACFATGALAAAAISCTRPHDTAEWGFMIARVPFLCGAIFLLSSLYRGEPLIDALWGTGHILQFGFVTLMMAIWLRLDERAGAPATSARLAIPLFVAASLPAMFAPVLQITGMLDQPTMHAFHTQLMRWANWPAPLALGLILLHRKTSSLDTLGLAPSVALFAIGILAGAAIDSQTTMIPAHYHGTIGAFSLALMAAALTRVSPRTDMCGAIIPSRRPLFIYFFGIATLIAGLAWSGSLGAQRKTAFIAQGADLPTTLAAALTGTGGAITIAGVVYFVTVAAPRIARLCTQHPHSKTTATASMFAAAH